MKKNNRAKSKAAVSVTSNIVPEFWKWLQENLFTHTFFHNKFFPHEVTLYSRQPRVALSEHLRQMEEQFTREALYRAVTKACGTHKRNRDAVWFHVNVIDQAVWTLEDYKEYPFPLPYSEKPLATLFWRMEKYPQTKLAQLTLDC